MGDAKKILIVRGGGIGDVLMCTPIPKLLKEKYGDDTKVYFATLPEHFGIFQTTPDTRVIYVGGQEPIDMPTLGIGRVFPNRPTLPLKLNQFKALVRRKDFVPVSGVADPVETITHPHIDGVFNMTTFQSHSELDEVYNLNGIPEGSAQRYEKSRVDILAEVCGVEYGDELAVPVMALTSDELEWADDYLKSTGMESPYVGVCMSAVSPIRNWLPEYYDRLIEAMKAEKMTAVLLDKSPHTITTSNVRVINTTNKLTIREAAAVISQCSVMVTPDTGLMHVAVAQDVPAVAIFASEDPALRINRYIGIEGLSTPDAECKSYPCHAGEQATCGNKPYRFDCMKKITYEIVLDKVKKILATKGKQPQQFRGQIVKKQVIKKQIHTENVSVIIIAHNGIQYTKKCIEAIVRSQVKPHEIIFIDNGSTDATFKKFGGCEDIKYIRLHKNVGCPEARNIGAVNATGDWLWFIDNDQYVAPDTLGKYLNHSEADLLGAEHKEVNDQLIGCDYQGGENVYLGGGGLMVRRKVFERLNGFDEIFSPFFCADSDFFWRAVEAGCLWRYVERHGITHEGHSTVENQNSFDYREIHKRNHEILKDRWGGKIPVKLIHNSGENFVSVLMCVYNSEQTVGRAIESILGQSYQNYEFIIIDDGSTDSTGDIIKSYDDNRIKYHKSNQNIGLTRALNVGLRISKGEYIARQDADDWSYPERLLKQVGFLNTHSNCWIVGSWMTKSGTDSGSKHMREYPARGKALCDLAGIIASGSSMFRREEIIRHCGGYDENFRYAQDFKQYVDIIKAGGEIGAIQYEGYNYVVNTPGSITVEYRVEQRACGDRIRGLSHVPKVGILIISCNRKYTLRKSVQQIIDNTDTPYVLYLLDNGSIDGTWDLINTFKTQHPDRIVCLRSETNLGCPGGREYAMEKIDNDYVAWIDDDMMVDSGWLKPLVGRMDNDPQIGAVGFKWLQKNNDRYNIGGQIKKMSGDHAIIYHPPNPEDELDRIDYFTGGGSLIRRAAYNWSKANPRIDVVADVYLGQSILRDGWKIVGEPQSTARHWHDTADKNYFKSYKRGGKTLRNAIDRVNREFSYRLIRNSGWAYSAKGRILLLFPPPPRKGSVRFGMPPPMFPHGIESIAAYLRSKKQTVRVIDYRIENQDIKEVITKFDPDWIGCYTCTIGWSQTREWLRNIKNTTKVPIVVGGPHATLFPESIPKWVDHIICGEGEEAFWNLINNENANKRITVAERISDISQLPILKYRLLRDKNYIRHDNQSFGLTDMASLNTSRGCPFSCRFCSARKIFGTKYTTMSAETVDKHLHEIVRLGYKSVYFREDNWSVDKKRAIQIAKNCKKYGLKFAAESRVDTFDDDALDVMANNGCVGFYIGVESGSQKVLDAMNKKITVEGIRTFFEKCHARDIKTCASMIVGYPGETEVDLNATLELVRHIKPNHKTWNPFVGMPGSDIAEEMKRNGDYEEIDDDGIIYPKGYKENRRQCLQFQRSI